MNNVLVLSLYLAIRTIAKLLSLSDSTLLDRLNAGESSALEDIIKLYAPVLCRFAEKFLTDHYLAEDIVQETFLNVWRSGKTFVSSESFRGYLYMTTKNGCLKWIRGQERRENKHKAAAALDPAEAEPVLAEIVRSESIALIYRVVSTLTPKMQAIFFLSYREGMTVSEISEHLGMNLKAVKKQKYKTLVILRKKFGNHRESLLSILSLLLR